MAILVNSQVHGAETAAANLLLDHILVDLVHRTVVFTAAVVGARIECFFDSLAA